MDFIHSIDWMQLLRCFVVGGLICIVGQILIDKTKLTPARILVIFVTAGAILGGLGIYKYLIDFAGAGATVPLTGFGANLAKGAMEEVQKSGLLGAFVGGVKASAGRNCRCCILWLYSIFNCQTKNKETINHLYYKNLYNRKALLIKFYSTLKLSYYINKEMLSTLYPASFINN